MADKQVLIGWNDATFDLDYLYERTKIVKPSQSPCRRCRQLDCPYGDDLHVSRPKRKAVVQDNARVQNPFVTQMVPVTFSK